MGRGFTWVQLEERERAIYMLMYILEGNGREGPGEEEKAAMRVARYPVLQPASVAPLKTQGL